MSASQYNFAIEQGSSFRLSIVYKDSNSQPIDITGYCARLVWKTMSGDVSVFSTTNTDYSQYKFSIDGPNGQILLLIPISTTNQYDFTSAKYDLELQAPTELYPGGGKQTLRILYGTITIIKRFSNTSTMLDCTV